MTYAQFRIELTGKQVSFQFGFLPTLTDSLFTSARIRICVYATFVSALLHSLDTTHNHTILIHAEMRAAGKSEEWIINKKKCIQKGLRLFRHEDGEMIVWVPSEQSFDYKGKHVTVEQYFLEAYEIKLKFPKVRYGILMFCLAVAYSHTCICCDRDPSGERCRKSGFLLFTIIGSQSRSPCTRKQIDSSK